MLLSSIKAYEALHSLSNVPLFSDHYLFMNQGTQPVQLSEHLTGLGIIAITSGQAEIKVNENRLRLDPTNFLIVNQGSTFSMKTTRDTSVIMLFFRSLLIDVVAAELLNRHPTVTDNLEALKDKTLIAHIHFINASIKNQLEQLMNIGRSCASFQALKADAVLRSLLMDISKQNIEAIGISKQLKVIKKSTRVSLYHRLVITKNWMDENFRQKITLHESARMAMMNEAHFLRNFKLAFGLTPHQYLMQLRLEASKMLLTTTDKTMTEISEHIGFETLSSFSYQFSKMVGLSPTAYRGKLNPV